VWLDVTNDETRVPLYNGVICIKAARLSKGARNLRQNRHNRPKKFVIDSSNGLISNEDIDDGSKSDDEVLRLEHKKVMRPPAPSMASVPRDIDSDNEDGSPMTKRSKEAGQGKKLRRHSSDELLIQLESHESGGLDLTPMKHSPETDEMMTNLFSADSNGPSATSGGSINNDETDLASLF